VPGIDSVAFFDAVASKMHDDPQAYEILGDVDLDLAVVMRRPDGSAFRVLIAFRGIACERVVELEPGDEERADCVLDGPLDAWAEMFDDIRSHGRATGRQTVNSLTLLGDRMVVRGTDPLGVDKFFRYNQTVQAFLDGAAGVVPADVS